MNARRSRDGKLELAITHGPFVTSYHPPPFATDLVRANGTGTLKRGKLQDTYLLLLLLYNPRPFLPQLPHEICHPLSLSFLSTHSSRATNRLELFI